MYYRRRDVESIVGIRHLTTLTVRPGIAYGFRRTMALNDNRKSVETIVAVTFGESNLRLMHAH